MSAMINYELNEETKETVFKDVWGISDIEDVELMMGLEEGERLNNEERWEILKRLTKLVNERRMMVEIEDVKFLITDYIEEKGE